MSDQLLLAFERFPREKQLVGHMILAYSELEFALLNILSSVLRDSKPAIRTLYQLRSEANRLAVVDAIATPWFEQAGLAAKLRTGIDAARHCKNIRNQYAHCHWLADDEFVRFVSLETTAKARDGKHEARARPITLALLEKQYAFFDYADHLLLWLGQEYRIKTGQPPQSDRRIPEPKQTPPPKLDSRGEELPPQ